MADRLDNYRLLGRSGLRVSPLSLGTMTYGAKGAWASSEEEAKEQVDLFIDRGGNFIDTANFYSMGASELILGRAIKGKRHPLVISTKYTLTMGPGDPNASGNHRKNMVHAVEESLKRLGTDYIDLLYLHMWDSTTPPEEVLRGFDDLVRAGKVLYAGVSDTPAWQVSRMQAIADLRGWTPLVALQIPYSLAERDVERELLPMALEMGLGACPWGPLAGGILTGKYSRDDLPKKGMDLSAIDSRKDIVIATGRLTPEALDIADVVKEVAKEQGYTAAQVALAWTLVHPAVASPLIGARTAAQLEENLKALEISFTDDQLQRLDKVSAIKLGFPHDLLGGPHFAGMLGGVSIRKR